MNPSHPASPGAAMKFAKSLLPTNPIGMLLLTGCFSVLFHIGIHAWLETTAAWKAEERASRTPTFAQQLAKENADKEITGPTSEIYWRIIEKSKVKMRNGNRWFDVLIGENDLAGARQHNLLHHWLRQAGFKVEIHKGWGIVEDYTDSDRKVKQKIHYNIRIHIDHLYGWDKLE